MESLVKIARLLFATVSVLPFAIAVGCASDPDAESNREGMSESTTDESLDALVGVSCSVAQARRVDVALRSGACANVKGERGTWIARPIFPDAPEDVRSESCRFTWQGKSGSTPDLGALEGSVEGTFAPTCARGRVPNVAPIEGYDAGDEHTILPQGGSIGCDVCGKNRDRRGWLVLPPDERIGDRVRVRVSVAQANGTVTREARFLVPVPANATSLAVTFPKPPEGLHYVTDSLSIGGL